MTVGGLATGHALDQVAIRMKRRFASLGCPAVASTCGLVFLWCVMVACGGLAISPTAVAAPGDTAPGAGEPDRAGKASGSSRRAPHCGSVVTRDVTLHAHLTHCSGHGLIIGADGVTVDLNGFTMGGSGIGIYNRDGYDHVTVTSRGGRGKINFFQSVVISHGDDNAVRNIVGGLVDFAHSSGGVLAHSRLVRGVFLSRAHQIRVVDNTIAGLSTSTLDVSHSSRILVRGNTVSHGHRGIFFSKTEHSRILSNEVKLADEPAIWLTHRSNNNVVARNRVRGTFFAVGLYGIGVQVSSRNRIAHNVILKAVQGIVVGSPESFLADGFGRGVSRGNVVTQNTVRHGGIGIRAAQESSANTLLDQNVAALAGQGIRAGSPSTALADNLVKKNKGFGISAVRGVENLGGNVAIRNQGRPQCVHLRCRTIPPGT